MGDKRAPMQRILNRRWDGGDDSLDLICGHTVTAPHKAKLGLRAHCGKCLENSDGR